MAGKIEKFTQWLKSLFEDQYGIYELYSTRIDRKPLLKQVLKPGLNCGTDPCDFISVPTGEYSYTRVETWVAYSKKNGLPKYQEVYTPLRKDEYFGRR